MGWDERLFDLLDDLEGQAEAMYAAERDAELADRSRAEYAGVTLAGRLMASVGRDVLLDVEGTGPVRGELRRVGTGWCLVSGEAGDWLLTVDAIVAAEGVSDRAVPEVAWSSVARLGLGSALRRLADEGTRVRGGHAGGRAPRGRAHPGGQGLRGGRDDRRPGAQAVAVPGIGGRGAEPRDRLSQAARAGDAHVQNGALTKRAVTWNSP